jgi:hypothetical protein
MSNNDTPPARMTDITFHGVLAEHITTEVRVFSDFAVLDIKISNQSITLFTENVQEAYAIVRAICNHNIHNPNGYDTTDNYQDEEPF